MHCAIRYSLVNKDIPDNCVAAGNPCKVIMGLEEYHEKRKASQVAEAKELVQLYRERYGRDLMTFLNATTYTENCYQCQYARIERSGDITLGDSWGSDLEKSIQDKGVSLVLCQNEKGKELINQTDLTLVEVDLKKAIEYNHQLYQPSPQLLYV